MDQEFQIFTTIRYDTQLKHVSSMSSLDYAGWNYSTESPLYMLDYHRDRLLKAARHWDWEPAIDILSSEHALEHLSKLVLDHVDSQALDPLRIKILVSSEGQVKIESGATKHKALGNLFPKRLPSPQEATTDADPQKLPVFTLSLDSAPTASSPFTNFKTTRRAMYDAARQRAGLGLTDPREVLVINENNNEIMEGTILTPYFWRNARWVTPPVPTQYGHGVGSGGQDGTTRRWALERGLAVEEPVLANSLVHGEECWLSNGLQGFVFAQVDLKSNK